MGLIEALTWTSQRKARFKIFTLTLFAILSHQWLMKNLQSTQVISHTDYYHYLILSSSWIFFYLILLGSIIISTCWYGIGSQQNFYYFVLNHIGHINSLSKMGKIIIRWGKKQRSLASNSIWKWSISICHITLEYMLLLFLERWVIWRKINQGKVKCNLLIIH